MSKLIPATETKTIIYEAAYNDCIYESSMSVISLHKTRKGAEEAMMRHKRQEQLSWEEGEKLLREEINDDADYEILKGSPFDTHKAWGVFEYELKD